MPENDLADDPFLCSHPTSRERAEALRSIAKQAMIEYYKLQDPCGKGESPF